MTVVTVPEHVQVIILGQYLDVVTGGRGDNVQPLPAGTTWPDCHHLVYPISLERVHLVGTSVQAIWEPRPRRSPLTVTFLLSTKLDTSLARGP